MVTQRLTWSDEMASVFGLPPDKAPTNNDEFLALIHADDKVAVMDGIARAVRERTDLINEFRAVWPDGTVHWIAGHARVIHAATGIPDRILGVGMDISERKSLEEQLRQAQKMEAIGQLAGGVAHDFNNLLTAIRGYADLVRTTFDPGDQRRADLDEVVSATARAAGLTRQLLAFSRKQVLQLALVDVNSIIANISNMLRRLIGEHIQLVTTLAPDVALVRADAGQIEQILMNLAVNARDALPGGGRLAIETANVTLDDSMRCSTSPSSRDRT
jgi:PAS domain S-box-containing protein